MAAGEYVSVSSLCDTENADVERDIKEVASDEVGDHAELTTIYQKRGLEKELAAEVARQLMAHDALATHARDELGISEITTARPIQAAFASAATFLIGAAMPLLTAFFSPVGSLAVIVSTSSLIFLATLGALSAVAGGAPVGKAVVRVTFWGALAMIATAGVGKLFGVVA